MVVVFKEVKIYIGVIVTCLAYTGTCKEYIEIG